MALLLILLGDGDYGFWLSLLNESLSSCNLIDVCQLSDISCYCEGLHRVVYIINKYILTKLPRLLPILVIDDARGGLSHRSAQLRQGLVEPIIDGEEGEECGLPNRLGVRVILMRLHLQACLR